LDALDPLGAKKDDIMAQPKVAVSEPNKIANETITTNTTPMPKRKKLKKFPVKVFNYEIEKSR
jgi:hypothetical protein